MSEHRINIFSDDSTGCIGRRFLRVPSENHLITTGHQKLYYIRMYRAHLRMESDSNRYLFSDDSTDCKCRRFLRKDDK